MAKYTVDELGAMLKAHIHGSEKTLEEIKIQTTLHNGRLKTMEIWRARILGFCACVTLIILPIAIAVIKMNL